MGVHALWMTPKVHTIVNNDLDYLVEGYISEVTQVKCVYSLEWYNIPLRKYISHASTKFLYNNKSVDIISSHFRRYHIPNQYKMLNFLSY